MFLEVEGIAKNFNEHTVLQDVSFSLQHHQTLSILGRSGCGKSTLLKIIAGLEQQDNGKILLNGNDLSHTPAQERTIVYLFQEALLFPHLSVSANLGFGLQVRKFSKKETEQKVAETLAHLGLEEHAKKMPHQLSGGQKQRVAFGRALIINPPLILLDEPFSSLDVETREDMQQLYKTIAKEYNITALFVTHDLKEALIMGDSISYMEAGVLKVYNNKEEFIADERTGVQGEIGFWNKL